MTLRIADIAVQERHVAKSERVVVLVLSRPGTIDLNSTAHA